VVELDDAVGHVQWVVIRQRDHTGTEHDVLGSFGRCCNEELGRVDGLHAGRVVFADPGLGETEFVEQRHELEVTLERERRILSNRMEGSEEDAVPEGDGHSSNLRNCESGEKLARYSQ
jgi:hypothetical protein